MMKIKSVNYVSPGKDDEEYKVELEYVYTRYLLCSSLLRIVKIQDKNIRKYIKWVMLK